MDGTIVNGDCYWIVCDDQQDEDLLWLAVAIGNSSFSGVFYDRQFNNKLYSGRRRYISQYVEKFPLPDPNLAGSKEIISLAKAIYSSIDDMEFQEKLATLDKLVWSAFGLAVEESHR